MNSRLLSSSRLRRRALREPTITLKGLLYLGRAMELSETQASGIESQSSTPFDEVNYSTLERLNCHIFLYICVIIVYSYYS